MTFPTERERVWVSSPLYGAGLQVRKFLSMEWSEKERKNQARDNEGRLVSACARRSLSVLDLFLFVLVFFVFVFQQSFSKPLQTFDNYEVYVYDAAW